LKLLISLIVVLFVSAPVYAGPLADSLLPNQQTSIRAYLDGTGRQGMTVEAYLQGRIEGGIKNAEAFVTERRIKQLEQRFRRANEQKKTAIEDVAK